MMRDLFDMRIGILGIPMFLIGQIIVYFSFPVGSLETGINCVNFGESLGSLLSFFGLVVIFYSLISLTVNLAYTLYKYKQEEDSE